MNWVDSDALAPLWSVAKGDSEPAIRVAALDAASRFRLTEDGWRQFAELTQTMIMSEPAGSPERRRVLALAARVPLLSMRRHLRGMASNRDEPDRDVVAAALDQIGDPSRMRPLLEQASSDRGESFEKLAAMPVEDEGIVPDDVPPLPDGAAPNAALWRALLLARLGDLAPLDAILEGDGPEAELFWGSPWAAYNAIASIRPVPRPMRDHLLEAVERLSDSDRGRMARIIAWAATGVADAEGSPMAQPEEEPPPRPVPSSALVKQAVAATRRFPERLLDKQMSLEEIEVLVNLPPKRFATLVTKTIIEANKRAQALPLDVPANMVLGNEIVQFIPSHPPNADWPVAKLTIEQVTAERPALDDEQMAWVIALGSPDRVIKEMAGVLRPERTAVQQLRILHILGSAADHQCGRGGSPARGAGPGGGEALAGRIVLINDMQAAALPPPPSPPPSPAPPPAASRAPSHAAPPPPFELESLPPPGVEEREASSGVDEDGQSLGVDDAEPTEVEAEERRVHAQIRHEGKRRQTFVAGADNVIRCWIGLPEPEQAAVAPTPVPRVAIPAEGLPLTAELSWGDQSDHKRLLLPAERSARSGDCDLRIHVPEGEPFVSAEIAFRFRGRAFEVVQVEAFALGPGEQEQQHHKVQVRVQLRRRAVIELPESAEFDATLIWGAERSRSGQGGEPASASVRVFGGQGGKRYDLNDSKTAVKWLSEKLFATEKSFVRRRAERAGTEEVLDAGDKEVRELLRDMARHGANLHNQLREQGFQDPGERIQLLNQKPDDYVPLEFVYDRGYPADDARLCDGWLAAIATDGRDCPTCSQSPVSEADRGWAPVICPLGFWSLQKIIERLDTDGLEAETGEGQPSAPGPQRRHLPVIDTAVFACSHRVPDEERQSTWQALRQSFEAPLLANNWNEWRQAVEHHPPLLLVLPHHDVKGGLDFLQIGDEGLPAELGQLSRGQLTEIYVNPNGQQPGPILLLLGCRTAAPIEDGYVQLARRFQGLHASIVLGTMAEILGRHAAPLARELISQLVAVRDPQADFGTIMRRVRRRMLAKGYLMALCLVALGDALWRLTPRAPAAATPS
jgi:hypothetical protein